MIYYRFVNFIYDFKQAFVFKSDKPITKSEMMENQENFQNQNSIFEEEKQEVQNFKFVFTEIFIQETYLKINTDYDPNFTNNMKDEI